jgi:hypothetical protein
MEKTGILKQWNKSKRADNGYGIKLEGSDEWINYYGDQPAFNIGDKIKLDLTTSKNGNTYCNKYTILEANASAKVNPPMANTEVFKNDGARFGMIFNRAHEAFMEDQRLHPGKLLTQEDFINHFNWMKEVCDRCEDNYFEVH